MTETDHLTPALQTAVLAETTTQLHGIGVRSVPELVYRIAESALKGLIGSTYDERLPLAKSLPPNYPMSLPLELLTPMKAAVQQAIAHMLKVAIADPTDSLLSRGNRQAQGIANVFGEQLPQSDRTHPDVDLPTECFYG